jgi:hypothetical protein
VWEHVIDRRSVPAIGLDGAEVPSAKGLIAFRDWLVEESKRQGMPRLVNATGAGILFGGTFEQKLLAEVGLDWARRDTAGPRDPVRCDRASQEGPALTMPDNPIDRHLLNTLMSTHDPLPAPVSTHVMPYRTHSRKERIASTLVLRHRRVSDVERWSQSANLDPAWDRRAEIVGRFVPPGSHVLDLGAGREALSRYIPDDCSYTPADVIRRSQRTVVADVNCGEFPDGCFGVVAALGLFEYVHDVKALLTTIHQRAPLLVTSYCVRTTADPEPRLERGFVNEYSLNEFVDLCQSVGWTVRVADRIDVTAAFDQWVFAMTGQKAR